MATLEQHGIIIADREGDLTYIDIFTGEVRWRFDTDVEIGDRPVGHNSIILVTSKNNDLRAFR